MGSGLTDLSGIQDLCSLVKSGPSVRTSFCGTWLLMNTKDQRCDKECSIIVLYVVVSLILIIY